MPGETLFIYLGLGVLGLAILALGAGALWTKHRDPKDPPAS